MKPQILAAVVVVATALPGAAARASAQSGCDLTAQFSAPDSPRPRSNAVPVTVQFKNQGSAPCKKNRVQVNAFNGTRATGYARIVGGSRGAQPLPALEAGAEAVLEYSDNVASIPPNSKITYKVKYSSPANDSNNNNHLPTHTVTYQ